MSSQNSKENLFEIRCDHWYHCKQMPSISTTKLKYNGPVFKLFGLSIVVLIVLQFYHNNNVVQEYHHVKRTEQVNSTVLVNHTNRSTTTELPLLVDITTFYDFLAVIEDYDILAMNESANVLMDTFKESCFGIPDDMPQYTNDTPICQLDHDILGPTTVNKTKVKLEWVEQRLTRVKVGGYYAPTHCRSRHKVAILIPFRDRETNLAIFLNHIHPFLIKQLLDYRIFVIEQYGNGRFNKGSLYNIGYMESMRYGDWHCLFFHDVDLLPTDDRILYSCPRTPTHLSSSVENHGYQLGYLQLFGGVTSMTTSQYEAVNGYSNDFWGWGGEDDDMFVRVQAKRFPIVRYKLSIGRFATLAHKPGERNFNRWFRLSRSKRRFRQEGLSSIEYKLINITIRKLFTHILADVNPYHRLEE